MFRRTELRPAALTAHRNLMIHIVVFHVILVTIWLVRQEGIAWKTGLGVEKHLIAKVIDKRHLLFIQNISPLLIGSSHTYNSPQPAAVDQILNQ